MPLAVRRTSLTLLLPALALALSACGGGDDETGGDEPTVEEVLAEAKTNFDDAASVRIALATESVPESGNGVLGATGVLTPAPAFDGEVKVILNSFTADVPIISVGGVVYAQLGLLGPGWNELDPSEYGAPDPADFADPEAGISSLLTQLQEPEEGEQTREGETILTTYTGELPGEAVKGIIPSADDSVTYPTTVGIDDDGFATSVEITGPFFADGGDVTYDLGFSDYDEDVTVEAPAE